jgi:hypothetical protein
MSCIIKTEVRNTSEAIRAFGGRSSSEPMTIPVSCPSQHSVAEAGVMHDQRIGNTISSSRSRPTSQLMLVLTILDRNIHNASNDTKFGFF